MSFQLPKSQSVATLQQTGPSQKLQLNLGQEVEIIWADSFLTIRPFIAPMALKLQVWYRTLELVQFKRVSVGRYMPLFRVEGEGADTRIVTFSGFKNFVECWLRENAVPYKIKDIRLSFPVPRLDLVYGLRNSQPEVLMAMLTANQSCMVQCPTRYGKTHIMANLIRAYPGLYTIMCAPNYEICRQLYVELKALLPNRTVDILTSEMNTASKKMKAHPDWHPAKMPCDDITVTTFQSLRHCYPEAARLCLVDEVHTAAAPKTVEIINSLVYARRFGFSATTEGRFDGADLLIQGLVGPLVKKITFIDAVKEGALLPVKVHVVRSEYPAPAKRVHNDGREELLFAKTRRKQERDHIMLSRDRLQIWATICNEIIPKDWQTLIFVDTQEHGQILQSVIKDSVFVMAKTFANKNDRNDFKDRMIKGEILRCIATDIYSTGLTFPRLMAQCNACGGGGSIAATQKPGRLAGHCLEIGKTCGHLFEIFEDQVLVPKEFRYIQKDSEARIKQFKKLKYELNQYLDVNQLKEKFKP
jgi:superfamily II DNA or RNA helicase